MLFAAESEIEKSDSLQKSIKFIHFFLVLKHICVCTVMSVRVRACIVRLHISFAARSSVT